MKRFPKVLKKIFYVAVAVLIPGLLILNAIQAERYMKIEREIKELEKKQLIFFLSRFNKVVGNASSVTTGCDSCALAGSHNRITFPCPEKNYIFKINRFSFK